MKRNKGITLIALVVTIIVLLILAGISISMLTGQNGILKRASEAKEKTIQAEKEESSIVDEYERAIDKYISNLPSTKETMPYLPDAMKFEILPETNLNSGLVIREKATGSEYVWVEVPKTTEVYLTAGINIVSFTDQEYEKIENDLHTYTKEYRNGTNYSDVYSEDQAEGWFTNKEQYNDLKNDMLKSVYQNGGFWVGRYEAGTESNRVDTKSDLEIPKSKKDLYPYKYITRTTAKVLAEKVESGKYTSSLMFGLQWDLILKYFESKNVATIAELTENSSEWGNYINKLWKITDNYSKYSIDNGKSFFNCPYTKDEIKSVALTTGANKDFSKMNIYDIAGNMWEWTLEFSNNTSLPCTNRGGGYSHEGTVFYANYRNPVAVDKGAGSNVGFRVTIF